MKVLIGVNVLDSVDALVYGNHCKFWYQCAKAFPEWKFDLLAPRRMSIDRMRNMCSKHAMDGEYDILVFIDDDILLPDHAFRDLMELLLYGDENKIVSGLTHIRGYPYLPMLFKKRLAEGKQVLGIFEDYKQYIRSDGAILCDAVGFSFVAIPVKLLLKVPPPHFITGVLNTEDVYFCCKAKDKFPEIIILAQTKIETGHLGDKMVIHPHTIEKFKAIEEAHWLKMPETGRNLNWVESKIKKEPVIEHVA